MLSAFQALLHLILIDSLPERPSDVPEVLHSYERADVGLKPTTASGRQTEASRNHCIQRHRRCRPES